MITEAQLKKFAPKADLSRLVAINKAVEKFDLKTGRRLRYFLAQTYYETLGFTKFVEDLEYTHADRLIAVWPTRFTLNQDEAGSRGFAPDYLNNELKLANFVYASRFGNSDVSSGDGYRFRGRGAIHLTFKDNYAKYSTDTFGDLRAVSDPDMLASDLAFDAAGWFWRTRDLNALADKDEFTNATRIISGSIATVAGRILVLNRANTIF